MGSVKGGDWEREVSRILSKWWTLGDRDDVVWRTSSSGARASARRKKGKKDPNNAGDLRADDPIAQPLFDFFLVECKRGYAKSRPSDSINILYWLDRPKGTKPPLLLRWWEQAEKERLWAGRYRTLFLFRRTAKRACAMMELDLFMEMQEYEGLYPGIVISLFLGDKPIAEQGPFAVVDLETFLAWLSPETIILLQTT